MEVDIFGAITEASTLALSSHPECSCTHVAPGNAYTVWQ